MPVGWLVATIWWIEWILKLNFFHFYSLQIVSELTTTTTVSGLIWCCTLELYYIVLCQSLQIPNLPRTWYMYIISERTDRCMSCHQQETNWTKCFTNGQRRTDRSPNVIAMLFIYDRGKSICVNINTILSHPNKDNNICCKRNRYHVAIWHNVRSISIQNKNPTCFQSIKRKIYQLIDKEENIMCIILGSLFGINIIMNDVCTNKMHEYQCRNTIW